MALASGTGAVSGVEILYIDGGSTIPTIPYSSSSYPGVSKLSFMLVLTGSWMVCAAEMEVED